MSALLHEQKSPSNWIRGIGLRYPPLICQITVNLSRHRIRSYRWRHKQRQVLQGPPPIYPRCLSTKLNSSSRCLVLPGDLPWFWRLESRETQSEQLLIWQLRKRWREPAKEGKKKKRFSFIMMSLFIPFYFRSMHVEEKLSVSKDKSLSSVN